LIVVVLFYSAGGREQVKNDNPHRRDSVNLLADEIRVNSIMLLSAGCGLALAKDSARQTEDKIYVHTSM
jgi:hypothetical protein